MALTIGQAAGILGVSPQRVSQMLQDGRLEGPSPPASGDRRNAARVSRKSLQAEQRRRDAASAGALRSQPVATLQQLSADDIHRLKIDLDEALGHLKRRGEQNRRLTNLLVEMAEALKEQQLVVDDADALSEMYSNLLTSRLVPDTGPPAA